MPEDFYEIQVKTKNPLRNWFHSSRHNIINSLVEKYYKNGDKIVDLACGNCLWNIKKLPVIGLDYSKKMLEYAKQKGRLKKYLVEDIKNTSLKDNSIDIIVISEAIEHIKEKEQTIKEIYRILKKGGIVITSVPYCTYFSIWKPLFKMQCIWQGYIKGDDYYKHNCGHINHFSPKKIRNLLEKFKFKVKEQFSNFRFTIFTVAEK